MRSQIVISTKKDLKHMMLQNETSNNLSDILSQIVIGSIVDVNKLSQMVIVSDVENLN